MGDVHNLPLDSQDFLRQALAMASKYLESHKPDPESYERMQERSLYDSTILQCIARGLSAVEAVAAAELVIATRRKL